MTNILRWSLTLALLAAASTAKSYDGYKVFRAVHLNSSQALSLKALEETSTRYDFWKSAKNEDDFADVMAHRQHWEDLERYLHRHDIRFHTLVDDVQQLLEEVGTSHHRSPRDGDRRGKLDWQTYHELPTIYSYLGEVAGRHDWIRNVSIGRTYEGRDMVVLEMLKAGEGKPNIWIEAGIHAREWISPAMATYLIDRLVNTNDENGFLDALNIRILPVANPDGYVYSWTDDRLWRKTRSRTGPGKCIGVDPNRNWAFHFGESGVDWYRCSEVYPGRVPFSEVETRNMRDYVLGIDPVPILSQCLHSYAEMWLHPYGFNYNPPPPENIDEIKALAEEAVDGLNSVHGKAFRVEPTAFFPGGGASDDWYKGVLGSRFVYFVELRPGRRDRHGFVLPPNQILPSGEELWEAMKIVLRRMVRISRESSA